MADSPELLDDAVRADIDRALVALERAAAGDDYLAIRRAIEALDHAAHPFAEERMNRAVRAAAVGRRIDEVASDMGGGGGK